MSELLNNLYGHGNKSIDDDNRDDNCMHHVSSALRWKTHITSTSSQHIRVHFETMKKFSDECRLAHLKVSEQRAIHFDYFIIYLLMSQ